MMTFNFELIVLYRHLSINLPFGLSFSKYYTQMVRQDRHYRGVQRNLPLNDYLEEI